MANKTYDIRDWTLKEFDADRLVYRPSPKTLMRALGVTLIAVIIIGGLVGTFGMPPGSAFEKEPGQAITQEEKDRRISDLNAAMEALRKSMPETESKLLDANVEKRSADRAAQRAADQQKFELIGTIGAALYWLVFTVAAFFAIAAPLSLLWQKVTIDLDYNSDLRVKYFELWPSTRVFPVAEMNAMAILAEEIIHYSRRNHYTEFEGWRWSVTLMGQNDSVTFQVDMEDTLPTKIDRMTQRVRTFTESLHHMTGIEPAAPALVRDRLETNLFGRRKSRKQVVTTQPRVRSQSQTFRSLDEVPDHMRAQVEQMMQQAQQSGDGMATQQVFRIRDSNGNEQTYYSIEEMPPEIRAKFEQRG